MLHVDNRYAIELMKNHVLHGRSKHIDVRFHFIREYIERGKLVVKFMVSQEHRTDILTKAFGRTKLEKMRKVLSKIILKVLQLCNLETCLE